jgi:inner membrane protein
MPSTLVHVALAALLAAALLDDAFGVRSLGVVLAAVVFVDLDVFVGWFVLGAHRAAFHTLLLPALLTVLFVYDVRVRDESLLVDRFGGTAPRVGGVALFALVVAGILPDLVTNGVNVLYPVHDQFYAFDGRLRYSTRRGVLQTFVEEQSAKGSTKQTQFRTGADPDPTKTIGGGGGGEQPNRPPPERVFLVVGSGLQLLLVAAGTVVTAVRLRDVRRHA